MRNLHEQPAKTPGKQQLAPDQSRKSVAIVFAVLFWVFAGKTKLHLDGSALSFTHSECSR